MRICKIISLKPDGKPWESQYGLMYPFYIVLEDGGAGVVNSKTEQPAYKVGDSVGYDITGNTTKGVPKLKITRNPKPGEGTVWVPDSNPDLEAATPVPQRSYLSPSPSPAPTRQNAPTASGTAVHGATVGMAVKAAVDIWLATGNRQAAGFDQQDAEDIEAIARKLVNVSQRIERGDTESVPF